MRKTVNALLGLGVFGALVWLERRHPLRQTQRESKLRRNARNVSLAALSAATIHLIERPIVEPLARLVERRHWGLLQRLRLPRWLETLLAVALLDYTLYVWHIVTHRLPALWRFHSVHHIDLDMDASTAIRFHFGEMAISMLWRAGQIVAIGVAPRALSAWQSALFVSVLFHHSNVGLPIAVERRLSRLIVTPRLHGIHHSIIAAESDSNWSSGLTIWDRLHGTLKLNIPQDEITIGVAALREPEDVTLPKILALPFREAGDLGRLPGEGEPHRENSGSPTGLLSE